MPVHKRQLVHAALLACAALIFPLAAADADAPPAKTGAATGEIVGKVVYGDKRQNFVIFPEILAHEANRSATIIGAQLLYGPSMAGTHEQLLVLNRETGRGEAIHFSQEMRHSLRRPIVFDPAPSLPIRQIRAGKFLGAAGRLAEQLAILDAAGALWLYQFTVPVPSVNYRGYDMPAYIFSGNVVAHLDPGTAFLPVRDFDGDEDDDIVILPPGKEHLLIGSFGSPKDFQTQTLDNPCRAGEPLLAALDADSALDILCLDAERTPVLAALQKDAFKPKPLSAAPLRFAGRPVFFAAPLIPGDADQVIAVDDRSVVVLRYDQPTHSLSIVSRRQFDGGIQSQRTLILRGEQPQRPAKIGLIENSPLRFHVLRLHDRNTLIAESTLEVPPLFQNFVLAAGTFNEIVAQGDDVILIDEETKIWALAKRNNLFTVPSVRVYTDSGLSTYSGEDGSFSLSGIPAGPISLSGSLVGQKLHSIPGKIFVQAGVMNHQWLYTQLESPEPDAGPRPCIGFNWDTMSWGNRPLGIRLLSCSYNSAVFGADDSMQNYSLDCCALPTSDIFVDRWQLTEESCPPDFAVVSSQTSTNLGLLNPRPVRLLCRKLNTSRYQFGPAQAGLYWGLGHTYRSEENAISRSDIPAGIRYGIGRETVHNFGADGCIGNPVGSVLVAKRGNYCRQMVFREIQYAGAPGDPPAGTAVKMFPDCRELDSPFNPNASCQSD